MTTATCSAPFNFFSFDWNTATIEDAELVRQLSFVPLLKEILILRQVHALEHATVWVLGELQKSTPAETTAVDNGLLSGLSTELGFYLYGEVDINALRRAVPLARYHLTNGNANLAIHPRCGTNLSVEMLLTASFAVVAHILLPRSPLEQLLGFGLAATTAAQLAPDLGSLAQQYLTTAIPFNLAIENITAMQDAWGRRAHFVKVCWVD